MSYRVPTIVCAPGRMRSPAHTTWPTCAGGSRAHFRREPGAENHRSGKLERQRDAVERTGARAAAFGRQGGDDREDEFTQPGHVLPESAEHLLLGHPLTLGDARIGGGD